MTGVRDKVVTVERLAELVRSAHAAGELVVLAHGCFDIVHPGHIRHLQHARKFGDRLVVTVSGDAVVRDKGATRPLIPQELRAENLAALDCVDWVAVSHESTAVELLEIVRPDVYIKGKEYEHNRDPRFQEEKRVVQANGGRVVFSSGDVVFSSTALIDALQSMAHPAHAAIRRLAERHGIDTAGLESTIEAFRGRRVLVLGETIIDTYVLCDRPEVAGESPMMTLRPVEYRSFDGGAAIIARHLAACGARPTLVTAWPPSARTEALRQRLELDGVEVHSVDVDHAIVEKQRFLVGTTKIMKLDLGEPLEIDAARRQRLIELTVELAGDQDAMIIADFGLGLLTAPMLDELCRRGRPHVGVLAGDVSGRRSNLLAMRQMDLICPSEEEARAALRDYDAGLSAVVWHLLHRTGSRRAIVTLGDEGLIAFEPRDDAPDAAAEEWSSKLHAEPVPSLVSQPIDQLGCGDALLATATLTLAAGGSLPLAAILGSVAAAAEASRLGNAVIGAADLRRGASQVIERRLTFDPPPQPSSVRYAHDQLSAAHS